jgi:hypothetical protein
MKITRVQYTVRPDFAARNKANIQAVMSELRRINARDLKYVSYVMDDGKTFMHIAHQNTRDAESLPGRLDSFKHFQTELKQNLEVPPKVETVELVGSSAELF